MLLEVANHVQLVVQFRNGIGSLSRLIHIHIGLGIIVHNEVLTPIGTDAVVHITQLRLYDFQTFVDKLASADSYLILVLNPSFTAYCNQGIQEIFSPLGIHIPIAHINDGSLLVADIHVQPGTN